jgi:putative aldouronate transport system substrate-binding protein
MATLMTNINTYVNESIARFIVGDMNIETEWDVFQRNLRNLGLQRYLEIIQTTYSNSSIARSRGHE